jgi:hypothetical protein
MWYYTSLDNQFSLCSKISSFMRQYIARQYIMRIFFLFEILTTFGILKWYLFKYFYTLSEHWLMFGNIILIIVDPIVAPLSNFCCIFENLVWLFKNIFHTSLLNNFWSLGTMFLNLTKTKINKEMLKVWFRKVLYIVL